MEGLRIPEFLSHRLQTSMTRADGRSGPNPPYGMSSFWWGYPSTACRDCASIHWHMRAARRKSGSGHEQAADAGLGLLLRWSEQLFVIRTPWVALSVVEARTQLLSAVKPNRSSQLRLKLFALSKTTASRKIKGQYHGHPPGKKNAQGVHKYPPTDIDMPRPRRVSDDSNCCCSVAKDRGVFFRR